LKGRRKMMRPAPKRKTPRAVVGQYWHHVASSLEVRQSVLTIKLNGIVLDALHKGTLDLLFGKDTLLLGLLEIGPEGEEKRGGDEGQNDGKAAEAPAPVDLLIKVLGGPGTSKGSDHVR
jgi:hypothetical protein